MEIPSILQPFVLLTVGHNYGISRWQPWKSLVGTLFWCLCFHEMGIAFYLLFVCMLGVYLYVCLYVCCICVVIAQMRSKASFWGLVCPFRSEFWNTAPVVRCLCETLLPSQPSLG